MKIAVQEPCAFKAWKMWRFLTHERTGDASVVKKEWLVANVLQDKEPPCSVNNGPMNNSFSKLISSAISKHSRVDSKFLFFLF